MIIYFSGRKESGKSTLSKYLIEHKGYRRISFADELKKLVSELYSLPLQYMYSVIEKERVRTGIYISRDIILKINEMYNLNIKYEYDVQLKSLREALQYIGTDLLRKQDPNFHINITFKNMEDNINYVLDDVRFLNEKEQLDQKGATGIFLLRPNHVNYDNHLSEISLNWTHFEYKIINDSTLGKMLTKFIKFYEFNLNPLLKKSKKRLDRRELCYLFYEKNRSIKDIAEYYNCSVDNVTWYARRYLIDIAWYKYRYNQNTFLTADKETAYFSGLLTADGCLKKSGKSLSKYIIELSSIDLYLVEETKKFFNTDKPYNTKEYRPHQFAYSISISSPYVIENLKLWQIKPRKSLQEEFPILIKENSDLINCWFIGLIDGDGSIYTTSSLVISCLCSNYICDVLLKEYQRYDPRVEYDCKKIKGLNNLNITGVNALRFYKEIYLNSGLEGLQRKWVRPLQYIENKVNALLEKESNNLGNSFLLFKWIKEEFLPICTEQSLETKINTCIYKYKKTMEKRNESSNIYRSR